VPIIEAFMVTYLESSSVLVSFCFCGSDLVAVRSAEGATTVAGG